jgi:hypothetical protein
VLAVLVDRGRFHPIPEIVTHFTGGGAYAARPHAMLLAASGLAVGGLGIAWYAYVREPSIPEQAVDAAPGVYAFLRDKWRVDESTTPSSSGRLRRRRSRRASPIRASPTAP